ncbi:MAG: hypothetical protein ACXWKS_08940 [Rhizomicrobium sp.]
MKRRLAVTGFGKRARGAAGLQFRVIQAAIRKAVLADGTQSGLLRWTLVAEHRSMLVERGLRVMHVEAASEALAIAWNYLSQTGAIDDARADNDLLVAIITDLFNRGEFNRIRLANLAITRFHAAH